MTAGRRSQRGRARRRHPAASEARRRLRPRVVAAVVALVLGLLAAILLTTRLRSRPGSEPIEPPAAPSSTASARPEIPLIDDLDRLDHRLVEAVEEAVARARADPADGEAFGQLGRVYHAHQYYALARRAYETAARLAPEQSDWPYYLGVFAAERGEREAAVRSFRTALDLAPGDLPATLRLANALLAAGDSAEADALFSRLLELAPDAAWGHLGRGRVAYRERRLDDAAAHLERATARAPRDREASYLLAMTYRELGRGEAADPLLAELGETTRSWPDDPRMDRIRHGRTDLKSLVEIADRLLAEGNAEGAAALLETVLSHDSGHFDALFNLGVIYGRQGRYQEARQTLERAIASRPESADAHFALAMALASIERFEEAGAELETVLRLDPSHAQARELVDRD